ncbi:MAG: hypothetical protein IJQ82_13740, partial [Selenomonadaceae bacterium]|nr:hypothetical protein [Selenomonadaceae bacterium]
MKFDVYFNGSNRWRAYNGGANGTTGITAQTNGDLSFFSNDTNVQQPTSICQTNQLQTVLLHMISGATTGIIEAWVDGEKIYTYTGDVNHGEDFEDLYLQSDGSGTFFSNVIISNKKLDFGDGWHSIYFDVERDVTKQFEINFDVERELIAPIYVPFIGEHFNHIIGSLNLKRGGKKKIILPKKSSVYIRATGDGAIRIFSDTDREGKKTGEFYAQLDECNTVFIVPTDSPLRVIRDFVHALSETTLSGTEALDEAINYATGGKFATQAALAVQFMNDLDSSSSYTDFLENYCDIDLDNADTGAITGSDAGGIEKTAESVVPEKIPVEDWIVPDSGEVVTINGLTVRFPNRFSGSTPAAFTAHILAGLYSVWIKQSLDLIEETYGISFNDEAVTRKSLSITLLWDSSNNAIAWTTFSSNDATIELTVNTSLFADIDTTSEDGALIPSSPKYYSVGYLDRTIVHELTHAIMRARIKNFSSLPLFIIEGTAELVHGIDDFRYSSIVDLLTTNKSTLEDILTGTIDGDSQDPYAAGYMFLRYLAKQGQNTKLVPAEIEITNLLISDGATDSDYEALTDNTRQIFAADILRALVCSFEGEFDIAILSVLTVKVLTDVLRNIIAQVNLFARQKEEPFNPDMPEPTPIDLPVNTKGIRDFEVSIAEQQISDQVRFTAVTPYDVQQEISGQYLDYKYNMVVERVQQQGILHSCECFSNINDLLYTQ